ncbi:hypothetical protein F8M41_012784 [Gigaspora margarita]|uniref:Uncharacterized protein n=1 Tax=Gigaspora margarita TaxID=4874 RepID=A0A8H4EUS1_GIGMA|nr:hypothetical protein F8M41_012784 [Gigaspora margarita]
MNLKPIPWHIHGMNQNLIPLRPVSLVIQKAIQQNTKSMPQKKITFSDTKRSKKRKSARPKNSSKKSSNASSDKKSSKDTRPLKIPTDNISLNAFFAILQSMVDSFSHTQPKEVSINCYNMINAEFIALKDPVLNHFTSNFSDKKREKFWYEITMIFSHILQPISDLI